MLVDRYFSYLEDVDDVEAHGIVKLIKEFMHISGEFVPSDLIPVLGWFGVQGKVLKSMKRIAKDLDNLVGGWVEEHKKIDSLNNKSLDKHDFIDVMLSAIQDDPLSHHDRDTIIKANVAVSLLKLIRGFFFFSVSIIYYSLFSNKLFILIFILKTLPKLDTRDDNASRTKSLQLVPH